MYRLSTSSSIPSRSRLMGDNLFSLMFFFILWAPLTVAATGLEKMDLQADRRELAHRPDSSTLGKNFLDFTKQYQAYFNDHFGLRDKLIEMHNFIKVFALNTSSSSRVILGEQRWLFYAGLSGEALNYYRALKPFSTEMLNSWAEGLQNRKNWLKAQGIEYLVVFCPDKETIYPEFMPKTINKVREFSRIDQLLTYSKNVIPDVNLLDIRDSLEKAKILHETYIRTDSHWNDYGAFIAYDRILSFLGERVSGLRPLPLSSFSLDRKALPCGGDLARMLRVGCHLADVTLTLNPQIPRRAKKSDATPDWVKKDDFSKPVVFEIQDPSLPHAVVFRDSFSTALIPFLSEHFSRVAYAWRGFDTSVVIAEKPSIVVEAFVERSLVWDKPFGEVPVVDQKPQTSHDSRSPNAERSGIQEARIPTAVPGSVIGTLDVLKVVNDLVILEGWASDKIEQKPAKRVLVFVGEDLLGDVSPHLDRPDVVQAFGQKFKGSGFYLQLPVKLFAGKKGRPLKILGLTENGVAGEIGYGEEALRNFNNLNELIGAKHREGKYW